MKMTRLFFVSGLLILASCGKTERAVKDGILDAGGRDLTQAVKASGHWRFVPSRFLEPGEVRQLQEEDVYLVGVPGPWTANLQDAEIPPQGYGTFLLSIRNIAPSPEVRNFAMEIPSAATAYSVFVNGQKILTNGVPGKSLEDSSAHGRKRIAIFPLPGESTEIEVLIHMSNYEDLSGGFWIAPMVGIQEAVLQGSQSRIAIDFLLFGSLLIMGMYHLVLFLYRRTSRELLLFSGLCITLAFRSIVTGDRFLYQFDWAMVHRLEYLTFFLTVGFVPVYFERLYPGEYYKPLGYGIAIVCLLFSLSLFLPSVYYTQGLVFFQIFLIPVMIYCITGVVLAAIRNKEQSFLFLTGAAILGFCAMNDVMYNLGIVVTGENNLSPFGLIAFILFQSSLLAAMFSGAFQAVEGLTRRLQSQADSFERFVPNEFIHVLSRKNVSDVELGDSRSVPMSVFFSDIRQFTQLSENLGAQDIIQFLNDYLQRVEPHITNNNGFVDKFVGDAIMALFQASGTARQDSVRAGLDILRELGEINEMRELTESAPISIGIGIHAGNVMLGTIGSKTRLDTTVVGDTVNIAARLESLTKLYKTEMLISETVYDGIKAEGSVPLESIRELDTVRLRGKTSALRIYEVFDHRPEPVRELLRQHSSRFLEARALYAEKNFLESASLFRELAKSAPAEHIYRLYYTRARKFAQSPPEGPWDGVHSVR